jgi:hypothetical protein
MVGQTKIVYYHYDTGDSKKIYGHTVISTYSETYQALEFLGPTTIALSSTSSNNYKIDIYDLDLSNMALISLIPRSNSLLDNS